MNNQHLMKFMHAMHHAPKTNCIQKWKNEVQTEVLIQAYNIQPYEYDTQTTVEKAEARERRQAVTDEQLVAHFKTYIDAYNQSESNEIMMKIRYYIEIAQLISASLVQALERYKAEHMGRRHGSTAD